MKRKLLTVALLLCSLLTFAQFSGNGSGTQSDPYQITTAEELNQVRNFLNTAGVYFKLMNSIDLTSFIAQNSPTEGWQPIGTSSNSFQGVFDGNCKNIGGLTINRPNIDYIGLFGFIKNATINRLMITDCNITGNTAIGGLSGRIDYSTTISECGVTGIITGQYAVGGLIGSIDGISSSHSFITNCFFNGSVIGNANGQCSAGGLVGYNRFGGITKCYAAGTVFSSYNVGGILGYFSNTGGTSPGYVSYCVAANTKLWGSNWTGRIIGQYDNNRYVSTTSRANASMEIYFQGSTTPRDNVYDGCNSSNGTDNGIGVETASLFQSSTYTALGWDFTNIWSIDEGESYPYFKWYDDGKPNYFDITISKYGVSTLYLDFPVEIPYNTYEPDLLGVYYAYDIVDNEVKLARLKNYIPAYTGVIVQGNSGTYRFPKTISQESPLQYNNWLSGTTKKTTVTEALGNAQQSGIIMTLGLGSNGYIGFYEFTGTTIPANRAYIVYENPANNAKALNLNLGMDPTCVKGVSEKEKMESWYTIQGTKINGIPSSQGIYINNGKKVIIK
ncbi:MAG: hypothetical protein IKX24_11605 [Prevotella sp.]|nr:hypothetical protein [Prevotella sp.]